MKDIWVEVKIIPRPEILDVQGRAITKTLKQNGYDVKACVSGKCIRLCVSADSRESAEEKVKKITEFVLRNPLTETYQVKAL